jgi:phosphoserine phosphatase
LNIKLVVFDVDGTLTTHNSIWWRLHELFNTETEGKIYYDQYFAGEIDYNTWADLDAGLWKGKSLQVVIDAVEHTEIVDGAYETVAELKRNGIFVAILSGGLDILAESIGKRVGIDYILTNELLHKDGVLTGDVVSHVGWGEKVSAIEQICTHFGVTLAETAFVGDGRNDISVLKVVGLPIAFNPEHKEVEEVAKVTIKNGSLNKILGYVMGGNKNNMKT